MDERTELIKSIRNRCEIYLALHQVTSPYIEAVIPTLLEDLYRDAQELALEYCAIKEGNGERKEGR